MKNHPFHSYVAEWFSRHFPGPTPAQEAGWPPIREGRHTLIAAPTGSGKTLAAFLWAINGLVEEAAHGSLADETQVIYVSPLKALGNDIQKNLQTPLSKILAIARENDSAFPEIRVAVRSGDTLARERQQMLKRPPHILITTPETLYILLTAEGSRRFLRSARTVIVDEIHAIAGDKRGSHLALSLERLDTLAGRSLQRIGLSATQKPIEEIARLLVGTKHLLADGSAHCAIVDEGHRRHLSLSVVAPDRRLGPISTNEIWAETYDRIAEAARKHRTTLVFVNTRRLVERVSFQLEQRLGLGKVAAHHGSLSRATRLKAEEGLKSGTIPVVVATASLELGIDIGTVDVVCHLGAPRSLAALLQRVGRSGHWRGGISRGILFPQTRDELMQAAAAVWAISCGNLDRVTIPEKPLDILSQQMVATLVSGELAEDELWQMCRRAYPYRHLDQKEFEDLLKMLSDGISDRRGRSTALIHRDRLQGRLKARRGARLTAITSGGAIPDVADYDVIEEPVETYVGKVNEDFAIESMAGDVFLLGNQSWRIRRVGSGKVRVEDAHGAAPTIPFWLGEAPARTAELSMAVSDLRERLHAWCVRTTVEGHQAVSWLREHCGLETSGAEQLLEYARETTQVLGTVPSQKTLVVERFFDEAGGMQLVLHAPFGGRINRTWGLALRKRFCLTFDFELQAAATDDGLVLSLGEQHSFPLTSVASMTRSHTVTADVIQAVLASPFFGNRWRWNASRALALPRFRGGKRVPMPIQRMRADDLLAAVFPNQVACQDNHAGPIELPDHPLVNETIKDCLHEPMDINGFLDVLQQLDNGKIEVVTRDTSAPSPMCHEILNANPYAFLDDAPLEERRARAVSLRRIDPELLNPLVTFDPRLVQEVLAQIWPDLRNADELHDLLLSVVLLPDREQKAWPQLTDELILQERAFWSSWTDANGTPRRALTSVERMSWVRSFLESVEFQPARVEPAWARDEARGKSAEEFLALMIQGWMELVGPVRTKALAARLGLSPSQIEIALARLEAQGQVLQGSFTGSDGDEWCERRLLARLHRQRIGTLRNEIAPVSAAEYLHFLLQWQHVEPGTQLHGKQGTLEIIRQLQGIELPAVAWEQEIFPRRIHQYDPAHMEDLCLSGLVGWGRLRIHEQPVSAGNGLDELQELRQTRRRQKPSRSAPLAFFLREEIPQFIDTALPALSALPGLTEAAKDVQQFLQHFGASFLQEIATGTGRLAAEVEDALWELVSRGLVTGDGVAGLRTLLLPPQKRRTPHQRLRVIKGGAGPNRLMPVGRWSLLRRTLNPLSQSSPFSSGLIEIESSRQKSPAPPSPEKLALQFLRRYGIVTREVLSRETLYPGWRSLLALFWRMEARGEIRGGRFVSGLPGEQFALPEAVDSLRSLRRSKNDPHPLTIVSSADPLNLIGILTPGEKVSPFAGLAIAFDRGIPLEIGELGEVLSRLQKTLSEKG